MATWTTITLQKLASYLENGLLTPLNSKDLAAGQTDRFTQAMTDVTNEIRQILQSSPNGGYTISATPNAVPPELVRPACYMVLLAMQASCPALVIDKDKRSIFEKAYTILDDYRAGKLRPSYPADPAASDVQSTPDAEVVRGHCPVATYHGLRGLLVVWCAIFAFAFSAGATSTILVIPPTNNVDVVSGVPFFTPLGVTRFQQVYPASAFGVAHVTITNVSFALAPFNFGTTLGFTNFQLALAVTTNAFTSTLVSNYTGFYTNVWGSSNLSLTVSSNGTFNANFTFTGGYGYQPTNGNLVVDVTMTLTNGNATANLNDWATPSNNVQRAWTAGSPYGPDVEALPTSFNYSTP